MTQEEIQTTLLKLFKSGPPFLLGDLVSPTTGASWAKAAPAATSAAAVSVMHSIVVTPYACWAWANVGIVTAINAAMDAAVATRLRNLRGIHSSI
jgi:hypothetical protein